VVLPARDIASRHSAPTSGWCLALSPAALDSLAASADVRQPPRAPTHPRASLRPLASRFARIVNPGVQSHIGATYRCKSTVMRTYGHRHRQTGKHMGIEQARLSRGSLMPTSCRARACPIEGVGGGRPSPQNPPADPVWGAKPGSIALAPNSCAHHFPPVIGV
jgi:hypothetical protein